MNLKKAADLCDEPIEEHELNTNIIHVDFNGSDMLTTDDVPKMSPHIS